jgi:hypothetical protein
VSHDRPQDCSGKDGAHFAVFVYLEFFKIDIRGKSFQNKKQSPTGRTVVTTGPVGSGQGGWLCLDLPLNQLSTGKDGMGAQAPLRSGALCVFVCLPYFI